VALPLKHAGTVFAALPDHRQGLLAMLGAAVLWSTGGLFIKAVSLDAFGVTMWRSLLAGIAIALVMRVRPFAPWRQGWITWGAAISYAAMLLLFVSATKLTTAANAIFLQYTAPLYVLVLGGILLNERPTRLDVLTVLVAFGGMGLFFVGQLDASDLGGNVAAIASGLAFAAFLVFLRLPGCAPEARPRAMVLGNALLVVVTLAVNLGRGSGEAFTPGLADAAGLIWLGVIQIGFAYVLFGFGIAHIAALEATLIGMLEPVLNPIWVFLFLGETPGWWAVLGGAIIIAAVASRTIISERRRPALLATEFHEAAVTS
jgi:drug/metabolite transporter (DMT)-like permease